MTGDMLIQQIIKATGLPSSLIRKELGKIIKDAGLDASALTLEQLRDVLGTYMQDVLVKAKETNGMAIESDNSIA